MGNITAYIILIVAAVAFGYSRANGFAKGAQVTFYNSCWH